ncbi:hypothetical protein ACH5RR_008173 [Cinchona calisaya]|uniref:Uncharacterized protein n=1 Tax=Cinchona calisaya TaxID=153742 RepID=A0ABD3AD63_9GENT
MFEESPSISRNQMAEDLVEILQKFELSEKEIGETAIDLQDFQEGVEDCKGSLLGKVIEDKVLNFIGVKNFTLHVNTKGVGRKISRIFLEFHDVLIRHIGNKKGKHIKIQVPVDTSLPL